MSAKFWKLHSIGASAFVKNLKDMDKVYDDELYAKKLTKKRVLVFALVAVAVAGICFGIWWGTLKDSPANATIGFLDNSRNWELINGVIGSYGLSMDELVQEKVTVCSQGGDYPIVKADRMMYGTYTDQSETDVKIEAEDRYHFLRQYVVIVNVGFEKGNSIATGNLYFLLREKDFLTERYAVAEVIKYEPQGGTR